MSTECNNPETWCDSLFRLHASFVFGGALAVHLLGVGHGG